MAKQNLNDAEMSNPFEVISREVRGIKELILDQLKTNRKNAPELPEIISLEEAAEFLRSSKSKLYQLTSRNEIPHYKQGARVLFRRSELLQWLDKFKQIDIHSANDSCDSFMAAKR